MDIERLLVQPLGPFVAYFEPLATRRTNSIIGDLLQVNILWGLMNLLPIYPLDGGQIARELFTLSNPRQASSNRCSFRSARQRWWPCMP